MLMVYVALILLGLCFGSFINALVWRIHEQEHETAKKKPNKKYLKSISISKGRSICPDCKHRLSFFDLIPVFSWLRLGGKCRYCHKPISIQYPLVEVLTVALFILSYQWWPESIEGTQLVIFGLWLVIVSGFITLTVYDLRWYILPNRIIYPLGWIAVAQAMLIVVSSSHPFNVFLNVLLAVMIGGGVFYLLFQISDGKWIGGGDVRLGWLLGLIIGTPSGSVLMIFLASLMGCLVSLPLMTVGRLKKTSVIPFGPFLMAAAFIVVLHGQSIIHWYQKLFLTPPV